MGLFKDFVEQMVPIYKADLRQQPEQELDKKSQLMKKFGSRLQKQTTANSTQAPDWTHV